MNNKLLNNPWVKEENLKGNNKKYTEQNRNEVTTYHNV